jgi:hypothetical protein
MNGKTVSRGKSATEMGVTGGAVSKCTSGKKVLQQLVNDEIQMSRSVLVAPDYQKEVLPLQQQT